MPWYDIDACRKAVAIKYDGPNWKYKVKHMSDAQIIALYNKFYVDKPKPLKTSEKTTYITQEKRVNPVVAENSSYCEQLAFDL